jgi:hypothetical protein
MMTYLLTGVIWSTAFVLIAIGPIGHIVAEANQAAPRPLAERIREPYLMTCAGVFLALFGAGTIASLRWSSRVFGTRCATPRWSAANSVSCSPRS